MLKLMKLVLYRIIHNKDFLIVYLILIPTVIGIAVYFTNTVSLNMRIGVIGEVEVVENDKVKYVYLDDVPNNSQLVLNEYDAVVVQEGNDFKVQSTKGEEYNQALKLFVTGQITSLQDDSLQRGNATTIIGFLMMVVLLLGGQIYCYYFDERNGINKRILSTSIGCRQYMLSHFSVTLMFLFIPAVVVICGCVTVFNIVLSIPMWQFILVLLLLCFFSASFGLWMNSLCNSMDESLMFGNMFAIAGSIVAGGFVQVTSNEIFNNIVQFLPQKQIMALLESLENSTALSYAGVFYVIGVSLILIVAGIIIERKRLPSR
ncbi:MAG: ABC transporter permease [Coprobacillus sp.]